MILAPVTSDTENCWCGPYSTSLENPLYLTPSVYTNRSESDFENKGGFSLLALPILNLRARRAKPESDSVDEVVESDGRGSKVDGVFSTGGLAYK